MAREKSNAGAKDEKQSAWDRAYQEVERSREDKSSPDLERFTDLTKSAGGKK